MIRKFIWYLNLISLHVFDSVCNINYKNQMLVKEGILSLLYIYIITLIQTPPSLSKCISFQIAR